MLTSFKIWGKAQIIYLAILIITSIVLTDVASAVELFYIAFMVLIVESFFSIPVIFFLWLTMEIITANSFSKTGIMLTLNICMAMSFYLCAICMVILFDDSLGSSMDFVQSIPFNLLTLGIIASGVISIYINRNEIFEKTLQNVEK